MSNIVFTPRGKGKPRLTTELQDQELFAIGYLMVQWAEMEHLLLLRSFELVEKLGIELPVDVTALSFKKRMGVFRALIKRSYCRKRDQRRRKNMLDLATKISSQERNRNRITHGLWRWDTKSPDRLRASSFRPTYQFEEPFDFEKLMRVGERVGEVCFELRFPRGEVQAMDEIAQSAAQPGRSMSRSFLLTRTGKAPQHEHPPRAKPLASPRELLQK